MTRRTDYATRKVETRARAIWTARNVPQALTCSTRGASFTPGRLGFAKRAS